MLHDNKNLDGFLFPESISEALDIFYASNGKAKFFAGGTWLMRSQLRNEKLPEVFISLGKIRGLNIFHDTSREVIIGSMNTHQLIEKKLQDADELSAVYCAASSSANPSVRGVATVGGNLMSKNFFSSDLFPALLACEATIEICTQSETSEILLEDFLNLNIEKKDAFIISKVKIPRGSFFSNHQRMLIRNAGEYPVANLSIKLTLNNDNISDIKIFVGSVEERPKAWSSLENELRGTQFNPQLVRELAKLHLSCFTGRDGADAPGWYRVRVLPKMICNAFQEINTSIIKAKN